MLAVKLSWLVHMFQANGALWVNLYSLLFWRLFYLDYIVALALSLLVFEVYKQMNAWLCRLKVLRILHLLTI